MSKEAMKLALEALNNSVDLVVEDAYNAEKLYGNYPTRQGKVGGLKILAENHKEAIKALEEALAKQEQHTISSRVNDVRVHIEHGKQHDEAMKRITAKQEQGEPVALETVYETIIHWDEGGGKRSRRELATRIAALYTTPYVPEGRQQRPSRSDIKPLSEAAIEGLAKFVAVDNFNYDFARAIEKAHGIKE